MKRLFLIIALNTVVCAYRLVAAKLLILIPVTPANLPDEKALSIFLQGVTDLKRLSPDIVIDRKLESDYKLDKKREDFDIYVKYDYVITVKFSLDHENSNCMTFSISAVRLKQGREDAKKFTIYTYDYFDSDEVENIPWRSYPINHIKDLAGSKPKIDFCVTAATSCRDETLARSKILETLKSDKYLSDMCYFHSGQKSRSYVCCSSTDCGKDASQVVIKFYKPDLSTITIGTVKKNDMSCANCWNRIKEETKKIVK